MPFDKGKYDVEYARANIRRKHIPFNMQNPDDVEIFQWLETVGNVTQYVKMLIRDDMNRKTADSLSKRLSD